MFKLSHLLSTTTLVSVLSYSSAVGATIPEGTYYTPLNIAGYNIIHSLTASKAAVVVNGQIARASNSACTDRPGSSCAVQLTWETQKAGKPLTITETVSWTSGVETKPQQFYLTVINDLQKQGPRLIKAG